MQAQPQNTPLHKAPLYKQLYVQVLVAITLGTLLGYFYPDFGASLKPLGDGFIKLVKMVIAPVIFLTVATGIAGMHELAAVGRVVWKSMLYFLVVSSFALILGMVVANIVQPGAAMHINPASLQASSVADYAAKAHEQTTVGFLMGIIPDSLLSGLLNGNILQTLMAAVLFAIAMVLVGEPARPLLQMMETASVVVFRLVAILMKFAPIGAFGAMAFTIGKFGIASLSNLAAILATFYATSLFFVVVVLGLIARLHGFSILALLRYLQSELLLVLGTSSSEAALPSLISKLEDAGAAKSVTGLVVPMGYSFNLDGTNIYMTLTALFLAQAVGVHLSLADQLLLLGVAMISSKGAAGVTGAGFITLAATLSIVPSIPIAAMALVLGVDRFMSECRSLTNFIGNAVAAIVVARWEGVLDREKLAQALGGELGTAAILPVNKQGTM
ncbi:C4-dicarboxylate transporter DctA [Novosphingobium sediminicola]